jgi:hypothetical protein
VRLFAARSALRLQRSPASPSSWISPDQVPTYINERFVLDIEKPGAAPIRTAS